MGNARLLKNFRFMVFRDPTLKKQLMACSEISGGFEIKNNYATYRPGNAPTAWPMQVVCGASASSLTFKYGMTSTENVELSEWVLSATTTKISRFDWLMVALFRDDGKLGAMWEIINAYPVSCKGPILNANTSEIAFEEIEVCHEGVQRVGAKKYWSIAYSAAETVLNRYASALSAVESAQEVAEFERERAAKERAEAELAKNELDAISEDLEKKYKDLLDGKDESQKDKIKKALNGDSLAYDNLDENEQKAIDNLKKASKNFEKAKYKYDIEQAEADAATAAEIGANEVLEEEEENLQKAYDAVDDFKYVIDTDDGLRNQRNELIGEKETEDEDEIEDSDEEEENEN